MPDVATVRPLNLPAAAFGESCARLRRMYPDYPRVYAVAAVAEQGKRRWWPLEAGLSSGRVELMYNRSLAEMSGREAAADVVATSLIHAVVGRVAALYVLEARAWDPGLDNLWMHHDADGGIDWAGVADTTIRVTAGDRACGSAGVATLPCEDSLARWVAHRCGTSLSAVFERMQESAGVPAERFWALVGESVVGAGAHVPILARSNIGTAGRRGQKLLDAMMSLGYPVRGSRCVLRTA